jgi:hypothetical protein
MSGVLISCARCCTDYLELIANATDRPSWYRWGLRAETIAPGGIIIIDFASDAVWVGLIHEYARVG